jgi:diadenosine tetraphosphate (Ap4A) HIT family hydrolase
MKPVSRRGETIYENLQVLCGKSSTSRSNPDDSDFRPGADQEFNDDCIFCAASKENKPIENDHAFAIPDKYPITEGHTLIIPRRHFASYFDSIQAEHDAIYALLKIREKQLLENDPLITGFDIGVNVGEVAGQKIFHCHIHSIPRKKGDSPQWGERSKSQPQGAYVEAIMISLQKCRIVSDTNIAPSRFYCSFSHNYKYLRQYFSRSYSW